MLTKSSFSKCVVIFVILVLVKNCNSLQKIKNISESKPKILNRSLKIGRSSSDGARGFFVHGGIFTLGKVLNFFPVGGERECKPSPTAPGVALAGICLNAYDCRQRDGRSAGDCAQGLGVCCVFEVTCGGTVQHNLTYFKSPGFPELWGGQRDCTITIEKAFAGITQLRIDFVHFTIGQPNRLTGECDEDAMILGEGANNFTVCGQNHGQHIYYTLSSGLETREAGGLPSSRSTKLLIRMRGADMPRLWLLRIAQMPLAQAAPHDCLQYFTGNNGTIKTFNFASNGRHLASQTYRACVRRNEGQCAVRYAQCDARSFRIGAEGDGDGGAAYPYTSNLGPGALGGAGSGFYGPDGQFLPGPGPSLGPSPGPTAGATSATTPRVTTVPDQLQDGAQVQQDMMPANDPQDQMQMEEGSGDVPELVTFPPLMRRPLPPPEQSFVQRIWSYIFPSWLWRQERALRWSPYLQNLNPDDGYRFYGYGNFGASALRYGRQRCKDRITIACESEYFVSSLSYGPGVCDPHHCGPSFCPHQHGHDCRVETSITPFTVTVNFGPPTFKRNPEENIGACLKYQQLPCDT